MIDALGDGDAGLVETPEAARTQRQNDQQRRPDRPRDERPRDERPRNDQQRNDQQRNDQQRDDRPRDDRPRDERPRNDQPRRPYPPQVAQNRVERVAEVATEQAVAAEPVAKVSTTTPMMPVFAPPVEASGEAPKPKPRSRAPRKPVDAAPQDKSTD